jgi:hypothetical protein
MPRAFDRGVPPVDKNPLISGTNYNDPQGIIGDAAGFWGQQVREGIPRAIKDITGIDITGVVEFMEWLVAQIGELLNLETWLELSQDLLGFFDWLWGAISSALGGEFAPVNDFLKPIFQFFVDLFDAFGDTFLPVLTAITGFLTWLWGLVESVLGGAFDAVEDFLKPIFELLVNLFGSLGATFLNVFEELINFFSDLFTNTGDVSAWLSNITTNLLSVIAALTGGSVASLEDGISKITAFTQSLPSIGSLISGLMGSKVNPTTGTNTTLPDLIWWASQLLLSTSVIPSFNLFGTIPADLLALIGVGSIGNVTNNLITDAGFSASTTLQAGFGWSWDGTNNATGSTGGTARVACDGGVKYLFSNLIPVSEGQQLTLSAKAKYTKGSAQAATIICGVRTYNGDTQTATQTIASLTATGTTSVGISGADAAGFKAITGTYTVPANVTQVRLVLGVTVGTTGTVVWFDEASLTKTNKLDQGLVTDLTGTLSELLPQGTFQDLLNRVGGLTGATVQQVQDVINGKLDPTSSLNGSKINAGNISSTFISELLATWTEGKQAIDGGAIPATATYGDLATALKGWGANIVGLQSLTSAAVTSINQAISAANGVALRATNLETRMAAVELKAGLPPGTPVTPPTIVSAFDDFERSSLGANWTVSYSGSNGSTLGIPNAHDAQYSNPSVTSVENRVAAIWAGTGSVSNSEYQKIYTTLGSRANPPAIGTTGFNDLIGRAASGQRCLVCRFFGTGQVQFLYRMNSWTDVAIGTFSIAIPPTTGTGLEFYCGDKTVNDQTKLYAKIGSTIIGPAYVSPSVLASMGKGWGFGMGHGLSGFSPQPAGIINYWGAQEQV